jgi:hypothetical protein
MITGTYNLIADPSWSLLQLNEVRLECDTTLGQVTINLPEISTLSQSTNLKLIIVDATANASTNNITINSFGSDTFDDSTTNQIILDTDGSSVAVQNISSNLWLAIESVGGSSSAPEDITYLSLYNKIVNSQLVPGKKYRLTDYKSVNFLNGWSIANNNPIPTDPNYIPQEVFIGENEILILEAISTYELNPIANSETYQGDIVEFQAYTNAIGVNFNIFTGATLPDSTIVTDFNLKWDGTNVYFDMPPNYPALFGHYFYVFADFNGGSYSQDGCFEPLTPVISQCQYPYSTDDILYNYPKKMSRLSVSADGMKVILLDLVEADYLAYDIDTLDVETIYKIDDAYGWVTRRNDTQRNISVPFDFRGRKYRRFQIDLTPLNSSLGLGYWGQGETYYGQATTGLFYDFGCFVQNGNDYYNIYWDGIGGPDMYYYAGFSDNNVIVSGFFRNKLQDFTFNNTFGNYSYENNFAFTFHDNTIGGMTGSITTGRFSGNLIGYNSQNNIFGLEVNNNNVGQNFVNNDFSFGFFQGNTVPNNCTYITSKVPIGPVNFNTSTIFAGTTYTKTIIYGSDGQYYISYYDGTNQQNVTPINS